MEGLAAIATQISEAQHLDLPDRIAKLVHLRDQITGHIAEDLLVFEETGGLESLRFKNPSSWLAHHTGISKGQGQRITAGGRLARKYDAIAAAMVDGVFTTDHLTQLGHLLPHRHTPFRAEMFARDHGMFVEFAQDLSFKEFSKACDAWRAICDDADPDAQAPEDKDLGIDFQDNLDGTTSIKGLILTTDAVILKKALINIANDLLRKEHQAKQAAKATEAETAATAAEGEASEGDDDSAAGDGDGVGESYAFGICDTPDTADTDGSSVEPVRPRGQRYRKAVALGLLSSLANTAQPGGKTPEPLLTVMIDHQTLMREAERYANCGPPPDPAEIFKPGYLCETFEGEPVNPRQAFELALKYRIARCVVDPKSRNVDLGRTQRLFKGAARDAVLYRDRACTEPGCDTPAAWCDVDHIEEWQDGGTTDTWNGQAKCRYHHRSKR